MEVTKRTEQSQIRSVFRQINKIGRPESRADMRPFNKTAKSQFNARVVYNILVAQWRGIIRNEELNQVGAGFFFPSASYLLLLCLRKARLLTEANLDLARFLFES